MKFFRKHKKKVLALCLPAVLLSCFMGFSISSSASNITESIPINNYTVFAVNLSATNSYSFSQVGDTFVLGPVNSLDAPAPFFKYFAISIQDYFQVPSVEGKSVMLSLSFNIDVELDTSVAYALQNGANILDAAGFRSVVLQINNQGIGPTSYVIRNNDGVQNPNDPLFWEFYAGDTDPLQIDVLFDLTSFIGQTFQHCYLLFPSNVNGSIWASPTQETYRFSISDFEYQYTYKPFSDVVQDDLSDIKGSLSGVNNKLDFISSSMNTIDQDVNRVNQTVSDLKDSFEDFQDDLTTPNTDISSSNSQLQDKITDVHDQISSIEQEVNDAVDNILDNVPGAENPFVGPDVPVLGDIWAKQFIDELWGFIKSYSILFTFIHTGLLFCLASFILRR